MYLFITGPDEYNAIVDNNFYTNLMARENIRSAMWALDRMKSLDEDAYNKLVEKLELEDEELEYWERIINNMYFPFDEKLQIYPQDDGFMMRKPWDESKIPEEKRHLLYENYHPLFVYRQKMSKQADAILGMLLHSNFFTEEELKRNYDFYQTVTLHHSSLSTCIFSIIRGFSEATALISAKFNTVSSISSQILASSRLVNTWLINRCFVSTMPHK